MKRRLFTERMYTNWAGEMFSWTVRLTVRMKDTVDKVLMLQAVLDTQRRYPYYSVRQEIERDEQGCEHFVYQDNPKPWVLSTTEQPVTLFSSEANDHLMAFACWDDCVALDFFHGLTDGTGAYHVLRTLLYEYCRRRYDADIDGTGIRKPGDTVSDDEWFDPASQPQPELHPLPEPLLPKAINLMQEHACPLGDRTETVNILIEEQQMMQYVRSGDTSPATLTALLMTRAVGRMHPDSPEAVPIATLAINQRAALHAPVACRSYASAVLLPLRRDMLAMDINTQQTIFRGMVILQSNDDNTATRFWLSAAGQQRLEQLPTVAARHQAMASAHLRTTSMTTCFVSYVGKANFGAAEQYIREMYTECDTPFAFGAEVSAVGGMFCISLMQRFADDTYLNAFLDELRGLGIGYTIRSRRQTVFAPIADYRTA